MALARQQWRARIKHPKVSLRDSGLLPVEIKLSPQGDKRALKALFDFVQTHDRPIGLVINNDERPRWLDERILALPAARL